jgi:hypothetical protein
VRGEAPDDDLLSVARTHFDKSVSRRREKIGIETWPNAPDADHNEDIKEVTNHDVFRRRHAALVAQELHGCFHLICFFSQSADLDREICNLLWPLCDLTGETVNRSARRQVLAARIDELLGG